MQGVVQFYPIPECIGQRGLIYSRKSTDVLNRMIGPDHPETMQGMMLLVEYRGVGKGPVS
jgi:hypothetical protein